MGETLDMSSQPDVPADEKAPLIDKDEADESGGGLEGGKVKVTRLITTEPIVIFYMMATSSAIPVLQQYIYTRLSQQYGYPDPNSRTNDANKTCTLENSLNTSDSTYQNVQAEASFWLVLLVGITLLPSIFVTTFMGPYSDKAGRKRAIIPPLLGGTLRTALNLAVIITDAPIWILVFGAAMDGFSGGIGSLLTGCFSYTIDISTAQTRMLRIVIIDVTLVLGTTAANVFVGVLIKYLGYAYPVGINLFMYALLFIYAIFLQETIIMDPKVKFFDYRHLQATIKMYLINTQNNRRWKLWIMLLIFAFTTLLGFGMAEVMTFYFLNPPFCWTSDKIGIFSGYDFIVKGVFSLLFIKLFHEKLPAFFIALLGLFSTAASYVTLAIATQPSTTYFAPVAGILAQVPMPVVRTVASRMVDISEQGSLFSSMAWVQLFSVALGGLVFQSVYVQTLPIYHGLIYIVAAITEMIPILLIIILWVGMMIEQNMDKYINRDVVSVSHVD